MWLLSSVQQAFDCEYLDLESIIRADGALVISRLDCLYSHRRSRLGERYKESERCLFTIDHVAQVSDHRNGYVFASFHGYNDLLNALVILKVDHAINAAIRAFLLSLIRLRVYKRASPPLELILIAVRKIAGRFQVFWRAIYFKINAGESVAQSLLN